jgi:hypothetical protein
MTTKIRRLNFEALALIVFATGAAITAVATASYGTLPDAAPAMPILLATVLFAGMGAIYMLPTIVAGNRRHREVMPIAAINLLLGWTVLGWLIALLWALTSNVSKVARCANGENPLETGHSAGQGLAWRGGLAS